MNDALEESIKGINSMVSADTLLSYLDWTIEFTLHTDDTDKIWVLLLLRIINLFHFSQGD